MGCSSLIQHTDIYEGAGPLWNDPQRCGQTLTTNDFLNLILGGANQILGGANQILGGAPTTTNKQLLDDIGNF